MARLMRAALFAVAIGCVCAEILHLNERSFKELVESDNSDTIWLLDFYAPWCGHCKRLDAVLEELDLLLPKDVKVGKIDATQEKKLAGLYHVSGFPTIKYRKGGKFFEYEGGRDVDSLKELFARLRAPAVAQINAADDVNALLEQNDVIFFLYNPKNDEKIATAFNTVATDLQAKGTFATTSSAEVANALQLDSVDSTDGFLVRLEHGQRPLYFTGGSLTDDKAMLEFTEKHNHPFMNHLTQFNYRSLASKGKTMSMLLVNYDDPTHKQTIQLFMSVAESLGEEGMNSFVFGHIDGVRWEKYFNRFEVSSPFPKLVFTKPDEEKYFHDATVDLADKQAVLRAFRGVISGESALHKMTWTTTFKILKSRILEGGQLTWMAVLSILSICVAIWLASPGKTSTTTEGEEEEKQQQEGEEKEKEKAEDENEKAKADEPSSSKKKSKRAKPKAD